MHVLATEEVRGVPRLHAELAFEVHGDARPLEEAVVQFHLLDPVVQVGAVDALDRVDAWHALGDDVERQDAFVQDVVGPVVVDQRGGAMSEPP